VPGQLYFGPGFISLRGLKRPENLVLQHVQIKNRVYEKLSKVKNTGIIGCLPKSEVENIKILNHV